MQKPKVAIIGTVGVPAGYGGFETLAENLITELSSEISFSVYCSKKRYAAKDRVKKYKGARLFYLPFDANGIQSIIYDCISIIHALLYADVLLVLGVSGGILLPLIKLFTRKKIIVSIDGIEWKRNKWSKLAKWYLWAAEWLAVKYSHADIADNESIQDYTAIRYKTLSFIAEYGANHTLKVKPTQEDKIKYPFVTQAYAFNVCRIEPENNIHVMLEAFYGLQQYTLVMVGNWNNSEYGKELKAKYEHFKNMILLDPVYDQRELDLLRGNCVAYIHGHSAGGTNPSLVEAMYLGLPVIAYNVSYNRTTTENKAFYFKTADELADIINTKKITELKAQAKVMKAIAERRYTWPVIASKYNYLVKKVLANPAKHKLTSIAGKKISERKLLQYELAHLTNPTFFYEKR